MLTTLIIIAVVAAIIIAAYMYAGRSLKSPVVEPAQSTISIAHLRKQTEEVDRVTRSRPPVEPVGRRVDYYRTQQMREADARRQCSERDETSILTDLTNPLNPLSPLSPLSVWSDPEPAPQETSEPPAYEPPAYDPPTYDPPSSDSSSYDSGYSSSDSSSYDSGSSSLSD